MLTHLHCQVSMPGLEASVNWDKVPVVLGHGHASEVSQLDEARYGCKLAPLIGLRDLMFEIYGKRLQQVEIRWPCSSRRPRAAGLHHARHAVRSASGLLQREFA